MTPWIGTAIGVGFRSSIHHEIDGKLLPTFGVFIPVKAKVNDGHRRSDPKHLAEPAPQPRLGVGELEPARHVAGRRSVNQPRSRLRLRRRGYDAAAQLQGRLLLFGRAAFVQLAMIRLIRHRLRQELDTFRVHLGGQQSDTGNVSAGRARLATRPASTGSSPAKAMTTGVEGAASLAAWAAGVDAARITSACVAAISFASSGKRSARPSA